MSVLLDSRKKGATVAQPNFLYAPRKNPVGEQDRRQKGGSSNIQDIQADYTRSAKVGNPIASSLKRNLIGIPALVVLSPVSNSYWGLLIGPFGLALGSLSLLKWGRGDGLRPRKTPENPDIPYINLKP